MHTDCGAICAAHLLHRMCSMVLRAYCVRHQAYLLLSLAFLQDTNGFFENLSSQRHGQGQVMLLEVGFPGLASVAYKATAVAASLAIGLHSTVLPHSWKNSKDGHIQISACCMLSWGALHDR
jgi:hypothetical protein